MERPLVTINGYGALEQLHYREVPVITFGQIAQVHGTSVDTVIKSFQRHQEDFVEGDDYFHLDRTEATHMGLQDSVSPDGLTVFTEAGYLLLVNPMRDKVAWKRVRHLRAAYFRDRPSAPGPPSAIDRAVMLLDMAIAWRDQQRQLTTIAKEEVQAQYAMIAAQQTIIASQQAILDAKDAALGAMQATDWLTHYGCAIEATRTDPDPDHDTPPETEE
jgi:hypothetical protein